MAYIRMIIVGLIVGILGRIVHPGRVDDPWLPVIALGIVGALIGGLLIRKWRPAQRTKRVPLWEIAGSILCGAVLIILAQVFGLA